MKHTRIAFSAGGLLEQAIDGFAARQAQIDMAEAVDEAIENHSTVIVEAGTGTGKTFAYLVPALMSGKKVIVSTGTKNLQEQLFHRDLPLIRDAVASEMDGQTIALLKGRSNYLCLHRLYQHTTHVPSNDKALIDDLNKVKHWSISTNYGDVSELESVSEQSTVFSYVTSTADNCIGSECPDFDECFLVRARKRAMEADVVVVNHHLFFADLAIKDTGFGELVPQAEVVIFDEAHQLPDIACDYFGQSLTSRQISELCRDVTMEYRAKLTDMKQLSKAAQKLELTVSDWRLCFPMEPMRGNWREHSARADIQQIMLRLQTDIDFLYQVLKLAVSRTKVIDQCFDRCVSIMAQLDRFNDVSKTGFSYWFETSRRQVSINLTPLSIADKFSEVIKQTDSSWIFTSATIAVNDSVEHYRQQMGLTGAKSLLLDSPFNYQEQAMLCVPRYLPEPNAYDRVDALVYIAKRLIMSLNGRCFLLFTSHRMLRMVAQKLSPEVTQPLLIQGQMGKMALLDKFIRSGNGVLLGTASFWEGVDVKGDALSCVMIDKLPFTAPDEPLLQARIEDCRLKGIEPFNHVQVPQAVIALKQGVGRLIRAVDDKGVLVICDNRLTSRQYGDVFVKSLPPMRRTRDLDKVCDFLKQLTANKERENNSSEST